MTEDNTARKALRPVTVSSNRERPLKREAPPARNLKNTEAHNIDFSLSSLSRISENKSLIEFRRLNGNKLKSVAPQVQDKYNTNVTNAIISGDGTKSCKPYRPACKSVSTLRGPQQIRQNLTSNNRSPKTNDVSNNKVSEMTANIPTQQQQEKQQKKVDALVLRNLKKNKEKQELEQLKKLEEEEHQRQAKEMLSERNKRIREMNARSFGRSRLLQMQERPEKRARRNARLEEKKEKEAGSLPRPLLSENERRAKLGLVFIDLQSKYFKTAGAITKKLSKGHGNKVVQKENEDNGNRTRPQKRTGIREYMQHKREKIVLEQRSKLQTEQAKRKKITQNISNLQHIVAKIFSRTQDSPAADLEAFNNPNPHSKKRLTNQQDYIRYLIYDAKHDKVQENIQSEKSSGTDDQLMDSIKQNLLSEMRRGRTEPESPVHGLQAKIQVIADRYHHLVGTEPEKRQKAATRIQRHFRGILSRRSRKDKLQENVVVEKEKVEENKPVVESRAQGTQVISPKISEGDMQNFGKLLQGSGSKSQNEKVVHLSQINTLEDVKEENGKTNTQPKTAQEIVEKPVPVLESVETQTDPPAANSDKKKKEGEMIIVKTPEKGGKNLRADEENKGEPNSLAEMRLLLGSEELVKDIAVANKQNSEERPTSSNGKQKQKKRTAAFQPNFEEASDEGSMELAGAENEASSLGGSVFDRNTFQEFTVRKLRQLAKVDNMSKLIGMREKVLKYKESTERHYIQKMFKAKRLSPKTYQSRRKELEHWVTKEKEEIKKTKRGLAETWKKVAQMIEDTNRNALQVRRILATHTLSYNSDTNSNMSLLLDSSRAATDREADDEIQIMKRMKAPTDSEAQKGLKHDKSLDNLSDMLLKSGEISGSPATSNKLPLSSEKSSPPEKLPKNFKELYESDSSDLSAEELMELAGSDKKRKSDAILIEDVNSPPPPKSPGEEEEEDPYKNLDLPKSEAKPAAENNVPPKSLNRSDEEAVNTEDIGIGWEISLIGQKPANTRNKPEDKHSSPSEINPKCVKQSEAINIVSEVSVDTSSGHLEAKKASSHTLPQTEELADEITSFIYKKVMEELFVRPFPVRQQRNEETTLRNVTQPPQQQQQSRDVGVPTGQQMLIQSLAAARRRGIRTDGNYIGAYLDDLFGEMLKSQKESFIAEINRSIVKPALELLSNLQSSLPEHNIPSLLPHEMSPIVPLNLYLDLEKMRENSLPQSKKSDLKSSDSPTPGFLEECEHIHDKAVFDSVNEALNLIRPYGLNGEPMPWSLQQRILFKSIADPGIIIRNIKNMVRP